MNRDGNIEIAAHVAALNDEIEFILGTLRGCAGQMQTPQRAAFGHVARKASAFFRGEHLTLPKLQGLTPQEESAANTAYRTHIEGFVQRFDALAVELFS